MIRNANARNYPKKLNITVWERVKLRTGFAPFVHRNMRDVLLEMQPGTRVSLQNPSQHFIIFLENIFRGTRISLGSEPTCILKKYHYAEYTSALNLN